jgi:hemolysin activation/secretion protein
VYAVADPAPGVLEVVEGRLVEVRIRSDRPTLTRRLQRLLLPLQGQVLHLPSLERDLLQVKRLPGLGQLRAQLNRLGGDSTRAVLEVEATAGAAPLQGDLSLRNDGNGGSGQFRGLATLAKEGLLLEGDSLLLYGEIDTDNTPDLGYSSGSLSYRLPLGPDLGFSTAFGASRRNLIEAAAPYDGLSYRQLQLLGQFDWTFQQSLRSRWYAFAGLSLNRNDAYLDGRPFPGLVGGGAEGQLHTGFLRAGVGWEGVLGEADLAGSLYGLQGLAGLSSAHQRQELASFAGVYPGEARALGGQLGASWRLGPRWQLQLIGAGQIALAPLTEPMGFSLGSDNGLRGLPGQVISGDSGLLGSAELSWSFWRQRQTELQLVPFLGAGLVQSQFPEGSVSDSIGAGGLLLRWLQGKNWLVELGWASQFGSASQSSWEDWLLGSGIYTKVAYRF